MKLQFDYLGRFRILAPDGETASPWENYRSIAVLHYQGKSYIAASQYGLLPQAETVYELGAVQPTELDNTYDSVDTRAEASACTGGDMTTCEESK